MKNQNITTRQHVCRFIDTWLSKNNIQNSKLANVLDVKPVSVKRWREGVCAPDIDLFPKLCKFMDVSINELLGMGGSVTLTPSQQEIIYKYVHDDNYRHLLDSYRDNNEMRVTINDILRLVK